MSGEDPDSIMRQLDQLAAEGFRGPEHVLADGKDLFTSYCMVCHGLDGQNTGVPFATAVSPPVPSLASAEVQSYTDGQLK